MTSKDKEGTMPSSMFSLEGKAAVVTGGGRGIGRGIALAFADAGADVAVLARTQAEIEAVAAEIKAKGRKALAIPTDVTKPQDIAKAVKRTTEELGRLDIWVNNAGGEFGLVASSPEMGYAVGTLQIEEAEWDRVVAVNLKGCFLCCQAAGRVMVERGGGAIINIGSMAAVTNAPGYAHYSAAKAGVMSLTLTLAAEWAPHDIRVNCILPGCITTPKVNWENEMLPPDIRQAFLAGVPLKRWGLPQDIAAAAVFLVSEASSYITGSCLEVAGGLGMHV